MKIGFGPTIHKVHGRLAAHCVRLMANNGDAGEMSLKKETDGIASDAEEFEVAMNIKALRSIRGQNACDANGIGGDDHVLGT